MKPFPKPTKSSYTPFQWTEARMALALHENRMHGYRWNEDEIRHNWVLARMLMVANLRRLRGGWAEIAKDTGISETRVRMVFKAFLKRAGVKKDLYPRYCR